MNTVKVSRLELLNKVKENKVQHKKDYDEAMIAYTEQAIQAIETLLLSARNGNITHCINVVKPKEFLREYDRAITMLEMSKEEILEISSQDFNQFVMDDWQWQDTFKNSTGLYKSLK